MLDFKDLVLKLADKRIAEAKAERELLKRAAGKKVISSASSSERPSGRRGACAGALW